MVEVLAPSASHLKVMEGGGMIGRCKEVVFLALLVFISTFPNSFLRFSLNLVKKLTELINQDEFPRPHGPSSCRVFPGHFMEAYMARCQQYILFPTGLSDTFPW